MGKRILLISNNTCSTPYAVFPLGIAHCAAALCEARHTVRLLDLLDPQADLEKEILSFKPHYLGLSQRNIDDLTIQACSVFTQSLQPVIARIRKISPAPVILGGSGFSLFPAQLLKRTGADYGIQGEGEATLPALIDALHCNDSLKSIPGLVYRAEGQVRINRQKPISTSRIPIALRPRPMSRWYLKQSAMLNLQTQRGCPFKCCYCTYPVIEGRRCRRRDYKDLGEELIRMRSLGCRYFFIVDSVFNTSAEHITQVCEEMLKRDTGMSWGGFLRPKGITRNLMSLMARAGLKHIEFGSDSLCDLTLQAYGKNFTFTDIYQASELARNLRVHYAHFLIMGGPEESESTLRESFENSGRLRKTVFFPFIGMRVYPRTALFDRACKEGVIRKDTDLLSPRFYVSPHISKQKMFTMLGDFQKKSPRWIFGSLPAAAAPVIKGLREKGVTGPLWEFLAR